MGTLESGVEVGEFTVIRRIGAGGMGIVYLAKQASLDRLVALKVLGSALSAGEQQERFHREAIAVAKLNHANIASVYFVGQDNEVCYMAMEYVDGATLKSVVEYLSEARNEDLDIDSAVECVRAKESAASPIRFDVATATTSQADRTDPRRDLPPPQTNPSRRVSETNQHVRRCCEIVRDVAVALEHAHNHGVIHRDIKPGNLMLDASGNVRVVDFGLAKFAEDMTLTHTGQLLGTPLYMSPEQIAGRLECDHRTDIYSLGATLYELLTLQPCVHGTEVQSILRAIATKELVPASWHNKAISRDLEGAVHKALAKDTDNRYQNAKEFADDLTRHLAGKPVTAAPYRYRLDTRELLSDRPTVVVAAAFLCFFGGLWFLVNSVLGWAQSDFSSDFFFLHADPINFGLFMRFLRSVLSVVCFFSAAGLLSGRRWGQVLYTILSVLVIYFCGFMIYTEAWEGPASAAYVVAFNGTFIVIISAVATITLSPKVTRWFDRCHDIRLAHRQRQVASTAHEGGRPSTLGGLGRPIAGFVVGLLLAIAIFSLGGKWMARQSLQLLKNGVLNGRAASGPYYLWTSSDVDDAYRFLSQSLQNPDEEVRQSARQALAYFRNAGPADASATALLALKSEDPDLQKFGARLVRARDLNDPRMMMALLSSNASDGGPRWQIRDALSEIGPAAATNLVDALKSNDASVRETAAVSLLDAVSDNEAWTIVEEGLLAATRDGDIYVRQAAVHTLANTRRQRLSAIAEQRLIECLDDTDPGVQSNAAWVLVHSDVPISTVILALDNENDLVRTRAATAVGNRRASQAVPTLIQMLNDNSHSVRRAAMLALGAIKDNITVADIVPHLEDENPRIRQPTIETLGALLSRDAVPNLVTVLAEDESPECRKAAAEALGQIGDGTAKNELIKALGDPDRKVRSASKEALRRIAPEL